jgi:hypothetical protein
VWRDGFVTGEPNAVLPNLIGDGDELNQGTELLQHSNCYKISMQKEWRQAHHLADDAGSAKELRLEPPWECAADAYCSCACVGT